MVRTKLSLAVMLIALTPVFAQEPPKNPYAGFEQRPIKALSAQQLDDLRNGRGMSLALAAELNGFPGPLHVLELGDQLALTDAQRTNVAALFAAMKAEAVPIGERLISQEADLDRQFAGQTVTPATLASATEAIGATQAALRNVHLKYHLATVDLLTSEQLRKYAELRGYAGTSPHRGHH